jgi:hypothetical protein
MKFIVGISVASGLCLTLMACSETTVMNRMGLGKSPPDETQVTTNNSLALPPDLQLRPPTEGAASETQGQRQAAAPVPTAPPDAFAAPAVQSDTSTGEIAAVEPTPYDTGEVQLQTDGSSTASTTSTVSAAPAVQSTAKSSLYGVAAREDAYQKFGISKTRPDGTPKTQAELDRELLEAVRREKRKQNPNYGTVFNIGELFKGN